MSTQGTLYKKKIQSPTVARTEILGGSGDLATIVPIQRTVKLFQYEFEL